MSHVYKQFSDDEVKQYLKWYEDKALTKAEVLQVLGLKDSRFYTLLAAYRKDPHSFTISYGRTKANNTLPPHVIACIRKELELDKRLIDNPAMPIMFYNYAAIRDAVETQTGIALSAQSVINYARRWNFYIERPKKKLHTREVITDSVGMLLQHDASLHQWSPYAIYSDGKPIKWSLITTLDDHSRKLLFAELFERESTWVHIEALESVVLTYGVGIQYYADNHSIFRFVADRDRNYTSAANYTRVLGTDDVAPQWKQCVEATGMKVAYALSPEAKGKIERPYRWLQDRIVRRAAREHARSLESVRELLRQEVDRYNNRQVHSTTKEIPAKRFERALAEGRTCFRPLNLSATRPPVTSTKDIFCLRTERRINGYGQITLAGNKLTVPGSLPDGTVIALHVIPNTDLTEVRFLRDNEMLGYQKIATPGSLRF